jgi:hypothetical protein
MLALRLFIIDRNVFTLSYISHQSWYHLLLFSLIHQGGYIYPFISIWIPCIAFLSFFQVLNIQRGPRVHESLVQSLFKVWIQRF